MTVFTDENFKGYEFRCTSASGNTGFKHICEVYRNNEPVDSCLSVVNWGNRTWESFQYATVLQDSKDKLQNLLDGIEKPEIDYAFLSKLVEQDIITDYGELENGETIKIHFKGDTPTNYWDIKMVDVNGKETVWATVEIFKSLDINLTMDQGMPSSECTQEPEK